MAHFISKTNTLPSNGLQSQVTEPTQKEHPPMENPYLKKTSSDTGVSGGLPRKPMAILSSVVARKIQGQLAPQKEIPEDPSGRIKREATSIPVSTDSPIDERSERNIRTLNPRVQETFRRFCGALQTHFEAKGIHAKLISGNRTYAEQDALYAKGRPEVCRANHLPSAQCAGPRVTNARGGYSNHNFGLAVDIGLFQGGQYLTDSPYYNEIGPVVAQFPELEWGGNWSRFQDKPHVQWRAHLTMAEMRERVDRGESIV